MIIILILHALALDDAAELASRGQRGAGLVDVCRVREFRMHPVDRSPHLADVGLVCRLFSGKLVNSPRQRGVIYAGNRRREE